MTSAPQTLGLPNTRRLQQEHQLRRHIQGPEGTSKPHLGAAHPMHHDRLHELGTELVMQGRLAEAEEAYHAAWEGRKAKLGEDHTLTHQSLRELAEARRRRGDHKGCAELLSSRQCHGFNQRHPTAGNATLAATSSHTHVSPKMYRSQRGALYPTPDPGPHLAGLEDHLKKQFMKRSFSMSADIRKSPSASLAGLGILAG
eukprot:gb/GFBE01021831.1/.p1 GENE.gb/GFBE01021831.1/~~gb/GFBE01021831.1/.p1  ORF type:complete len:200 (+),score=27.65 gb/GFBE01021831.1/:1-600(+)